MCMIDDGDPCEVSRSKMVVARKSHICEECGRDIAIGERYRYAFLVCDGDAISCHACAHCAVAQEWLTENCRGYCWSAVREDLEEHINEYPDLAFGLSRLTTGMKRKWRAFSNDGLLRIPTQPRSIQSVVHL